MHDLLSEEDEEPTSLIDEPIVKSPPEPTRVKSPEQMMIRSPEPVNWTVPLDTGKTFTVTQNVQGDYHTLKLQPFRSIPFILYFNRFESHSMRVWSRVRFVENYSCRMGLASVREQIKFLS